MGKNARAVSLAVSTAVGTVIAPLAAVAAPPPAVVSLPAPNAIAQQPDVPQDAMPENLPEDLPGELIRPPVPEAPGPTTPTVPPPADLLTPDDPNVPGSDLPEVPGTIVVERFNIVGGTVFSEAELAAAVEPFTNRPITFPELLQARSAITQLYVDAGYITSGAFVPADQRLVDGTIVIQIVEGQLETINITGLKRLNNSYVASRIRRAAGSPLNVPQLVEGLQLLQIDPRLDTIAAELSAGSRPGQSILDVMATQSRDTGVLLQVDNGRSPSVGSLRQRIRLSRANVVDGIGDEFAFTFTNTDGSEEFQFRYSVPLTASNTRLTLSFREADSRVIEDPFGDLDIESDSELYEATLVQPLREKPNETLLVGLSFTHQDSLTTIMGGEPFPFSGTDDDSGETAVSALRFFQEWTLRSQREVFAARSSLNFGIGAFDATDSNSGPDSNFFSWQGQAQYVRRLGTDTLLLLRANTQLADRPLLALEQFGTGGAGSVRGYRQDTLITDGGFFASAELRVPIARISQWDSTISVAPFFDYGTGRNADDSPDPEETNLAAVGVSLRWQVADWLSANLDYGIPLIDVNLENEDTLQEEGFLFSIVVEPLKF